MMKKLLFCLILLQPLLLNGQNNKLVEDLNKFNFNFEIDSNWRFVTFEEIKNKNPQGLSVLEDSELKAIRCLSLKNSNKITDYPNIILQIIKVPKGVFTKELLQKQADSIWTANPIIEQILKSASEANDTSNVIFLNALKNSKNYFDPEQCTMTTQMIINDGIEGDILVYNTTFFSEEYMATLKIYTKQTETNKYLSNFLRIVKNAGFKKSTRIK